MSKIGTLQTVEEKIAYIASKLQGWSYIYEGYNEANYEVGKMSLPCIINVLPESGQLVVTKNQQLDEVDCVIAFCDKMDYDDKAKSTDKDIIERLKRGAQAFIFALNDSELFHQVKTEIPYNVMFDQMDDNLAIVAIRLTLRETYGIPVCNLTTVSEVLKYER